MDDLIERLRAPLPKGLCGQSMGCNAASICLCSVIEDQRETLTEAADRIATQQEAIDELQRRLDDALIELQVLHKAIAITSMSEADHALF